MHTKAATLQNGIGAVLYIYLSAVIFILPPNLVTLSSLVFGSFILLYAAMYSKEFLMEREVPPTLFFLLVCVTLTSLVLVLVSEFPSKELINDAAFLIVAALLFYRRSIEATSNGIVERIFYWTGCVTLVYWAAVNVGAMGASYVFGRYDKNYFGVVVFLFFCWCWQRRKWPGIAAMILIALVLGSRNLQLSLCAFVVIVILKKLRELGAGPRAQSRLNREYTAAYESRRVRRVFTGFALMLVIIFAFSLWWTTSMVGSETVSYQSGLNDASNAMRFSSNWFGLEAFRADNSLWYRGYDSAIFDVLGIDQENVLESLSINGYRVVQPHHLVLNLLLKEGAIFTFLYFAVLSWILAGHIRWSNAEIWIPFALMNMFMHSLGMEYLLLFLLTALQTGRSFNLAGSDN